MPKKKKTGFIVGLIFAIAAVAAISYAVSFKTVNNNIRLQEATTEETTAAVITDEEFSVEPAIVSDIFSGATKVTIDEETDTLLLCLNRFSIVEDNYEPMLSKLNEGDNIYLEQAAAEAFESMYAAAKDAGIELTPLDGYTGFERQKRRYEEKVREFTEQGMETADAQIAASNYVMPAGHSEQYLGLMVWIGETSESFKESDAYLWLRNHAAEYGFIERYPSGKESLTCMVYMPWVWRYVGVDNAKTITGASECLEEYVN